MILDEQHIRQLADKLTSDNETERAHAEQTLRTANRDANDVLYRASKLVYNELKQSNPVSIIAVMCSPLPMLLLYWPRIVRDFGSYVWLAAFCYVTVLSAGFQDLKYNHGKAVTRFRRIALELERRGDRRAVEPLFDAWTPGEEKQTKNVGSTTIAVEAALRRVLMQLSAQTGLPLDGDQMGRLRNKLEGVFFPPVATQNREITDFSDGCADVLVTLIQLLSHSSEAADRVLVSKIAACPAQLPNQVLVQEAARDCLEAANLSHKLGQSISLSAPPLPSLAPSIPTPTNTIPPVVQQIRRP